MVKDYAVKSTTDYHLFSFISGNRKLNVPHLKRLENSISKRYLFSPIIVNEYYQIIDGQNRFTVCQKLGLPIYYVIAPGYGLEEVQILNTNSSNWKKVDYLNAYCDLKYPEYLKFRRFMQTYPQFGFQCCEHILSNTGSSNGATTLKECITETNKSGRIYQKSFENGDFVCVNYDYSCSVAEKILQVKDIAPSVVNRRAFVAAVIVLLKNSSFDWDDFITKLNQQPTALVECVNVGQYKLLIEEIYNWKRRQKVNLRF